MPKEIADEQEELRRRQAANDAGQGDNAEGDAGEDEGESDLQGDAEQLGGQEGDGEQGELGGDDDGGADDGDGEREQRQPTRRENRIQRLATERAEATARATLLEQEVQRLRSAENARSTQMTEEQEQARLALMSPDERSEYRFNKAERLAQQREANLRREIAISQDASSFSAKCASNSLYRKMQPVVEAEFQRLLAAGSPADRETIMRYKLGERMLDDANKRGGKMQREGKERVERETTRPANGRGGQPAQRGRQVDEAVARRARLEKMTF